MDKFYKVIANDNGEGEPYHAFPIGTNVRPMRVRGTWGDFQSLEDTVSVVTNIPHRAGLIQSLNLSDVEEVPA